MDNFQLMEDYLKGDLDQAGHKLFNSKLKNEPEFEIEFREMKAIKDASKISARFSALEQLEMIESSIQEKETTKVEFNMKKLVSVAASLVLIATVSYFTVFNTPNVATGQEIFSEHYQPYQNRITSAQRGGEALNVSALKLNAYDAYDAKRFDESANLFASLLKEEKNAANFLYSGIANLESGNLSEAKANFNTVMNDFEEFEAQSKWFMTMTLLKEDTEESIDEAVYSLGELIVDETSYKSDATAVLTKLGLAMKSSADSGTINDVTTNSNSQGDSPDGSYEEGRKTGYQWGKLTGSNGNKYRFFSNPPIAGLEAGDEVIYYGIAGIKRSSRAKSVSKGGWAIILDTVE